MKDFVKNTKMEANKLISQGPISITNEVLVDPQKKMNLSKDTENWIDLRYKIVRSRWKKVQIMQNMNLGPLQLDKIIKEPPTHFLTSRPHYQDDAATVDRSRGTLPAPPSEVKAGSQGKVQVKHRPTSALNYGNPRASSFKKLEAQAKESPDKTERISRQSSLRLAQGTVGLSKLRDKVLQVVTAMKFKNAAEKRVAGLSNLAERSVSQANYTLASPDKKKEPPQLRAGRRRSRRLSSGSVASYRSRVSSFAELHEEKPAKKSIKAIPAKSQHPDNDKSKEPKDDSLSSSSSPSKRSEEDSGVQLINETRPTFIVLNNAVSDTPELEKMPSFRYTRDIEGLLRKMKQKGPFNVVMALSDTENPEYLHVVLILLVHQKVHFIHGYYLGKFKKVRL